MQSDVRPAAVAGYFYPDHTEDLRRMVEDYLAEVQAEPRTARAAMVPHAGLIYSGRCAAEVFGRLKFADIVVIVAPNHTGRFGAPGGASLWARGSFETPLGAIPVAVEFAARLEAECDLVTHDPEAHSREHAVEVELPFLALLAPEAAIVPLVLAWDDWDRCERLGAALARMVSEWPADVLLVASSDMTHYESADHAARKDEIALAELRKLDGNGLLGACRREGITMCGRGPAAVVIEAARRLGADHCDVVDYRHSGQVTGDDSSVVAYAGVVVP